MCVKKSHCRIFPNSKTWWSKNIDTHIQNKHAWNTIYCIEARWQTNHHNIQCLKLASWGYTPVIYNIAMENGPLKMYFLLKLRINSIAILVYQRVDQFETRLHSWIIHFGEGWRAKSSFTEVEGTPEGQSEDCHAKTSWFWYTLSSIFLDDNLMEVENGWEWWK